MAKSPPEGDLAALGAREIVRRDCGNYGEDALVAWKLPDGDVVVEYVGTGDDRSGDPGRWLIDPADTLRVRSEGFVSAKMAGMESRLERVGIDGSTQTLAHFEFTAAWGGTYHDQVAELARRIAEAAGCGVVVVEPKISDSR